MSTRPTADPPDGRRSANAGGEAARLLEQVRVLLERLAVLQPSDVLSLPIVVPTDLAALLDERAQESGVPVPYVYSSCLMLGAWQAASENGLQEIAQQIAAIIKRYAPPQEWVRFRERHPEVVP